MKVARSVQNTQTLRLGRRRYSRRGRDSFFSLTSVITFSSRPCVIPRAVCLGGVPRRGHLRLGFRERAHPQSGTPFPRSALGQGSECRLPPLRPPSVFAHPEFRRI